MSDLDKFQVMVNAYPRLSHYWDFVDRVCDVNRVSDEIGKLSSGEQIMLRFFVGVWRGHNTNKFDLFDAARSLPNKDLTVIRTWLIDPYFP